MKTGLVYITDDTNKILFVVSSAVYVKEMAIVTMETHKLTSVFIFEVPPHDYSELHPATEAIELPSLPVISGDENL